MRSIKYHEEQITASEIILFITCQRAKGRIMKVSHNESRGEEVRGWDRDR